MPGQINNETICPGFLIFVWFEFISYANRDLDNGGEGRLFSDVSFAGNVCLTDLIELPSLINGNNLLDKTCQFRISNQSRGKCVNMGEAVIIRNTDRFEDTGGILESNISITDDGNGNVVIQ